MSTVMLISTEKLLLATKVLAYAIIIGTPLFYLKWSIYPFALPRTLFFQSLVELALAAWIVLMVQDRRFRPRRDTFTVSLFFFVGMLFLTAWTGVDMWRSVWSSEERTVGVFAIAHAALFGILLYCCRSIIPWKRLAVASLAVAALVSLLAFIQLGVPNLLAEENPGMRPGSTFGNPAFLSAYLLFNVFIAVYLLWREPAGRAQVNRRIWYGALGVCVLGAIITSQTRGAFLGLVVGTAVLFLFGLWYGSPHARKYLGITGLWIAILCLAFLGTRRADFWKTVPLLNRFQDFSLGSSGFVPRLAALQAAWEGFKERPLLGWGVENFNVVFNKYYEPRTLESGYTETRFDKPHNAFAEYAVGGGLVVLFAYLAWCGSLFTALFRGLAHGGEERLRAACLGAALVAYWTQNLFVFDTIGSLLMFAVVGAWIAGAGDGAQEENVKAGRTIPSNSFGLFLLPFVSLTAGAAIFFVNLAGLQTGIAQYRGFMTLAKNPTEGIAHFRAASTALSPYRSWARRDFAVAITEAHFQNPGKIPPAVVLEALAAMEQTAAEHPLDAFNHYMLVDLYNQAADIDPAELAKKAEREAAIALQLSPYRQEVYFSLAKTKTIAGDNAAALELLRQAIEINPKIPDGYFYYGLVAFSDGKLSEGYAALKKALELGRIWRNADEARVSANYFADSGHLEEAIELYKEALRLDPADVESEAKIALAYFSLGDHVSARAHFEKVMRTHDLRQSPSYAQLLPILRTLGLAP